MADLFNIDWTYMSELLFVPACILVVAFSIGVALNRVLEEKLRHHLKVDDLNLDIKSIFFHALRGIPINFCVMTGLYWIVNTSRLPEGLMRMFSYFLFTVIVYTMTKVLARTLTGIVAMKLSSTGSASQTTLLDTIIKIRLVAINPHHNITGNLKSNTLNLVKIAVVAHTNGNSNDNIITRH